MRSPLKVTINAKDYEVPIPGIARAFGFRSIIGAYRREDGPVAVVGVLASCWQGAAPWGDVPMLPSEHLPEYGARILVAAHAKGCDLMQIDSAAWAFIAALGESIAPPSQEAADTSKKSSSPTEAQTSEASSPPASGAATLSAGSDLREP